MEQKNQISEFQNSFKLSEKQLDFLAYDSKIDIAEGASGTGKTFILKLKFVTQVMLSNRKQHFIAGQDGTVVLRNIIDGDDGILAMFPNVKIGSDPKKGSHLLLTDQEGRRKIIYVFGFGDKSRWKKVLGSTMGIGLIDEGNLAEQDFFTQVFRGVTRPTAEYWIGISLNPTEPSNSIYTNLINKARPIQKYVHDIPDSIIEDLKKSPANSNYTYWHFNHKDNPFLTEEARNDYRAMLIPGTPEYMSLIEGIRANASGTVYAKYLDDGMLYNSIADFNTKDKYGATVPFNFDMLDIGIDIGAGDNENAKSVIGLTGFKRIDGKMHVYNEDDYMCKESHADKLLNEWVTEIDKYWHLYGTRIKGIYVDGSGVSKTLILSLQDRVKAANIFIDVAPAWKFGEDGGIKARMFVMFALINQRRIHFRKGNKTYSMLKKLVRGEKTFIEDKNDVWNDYYDEFCYSWTHRTEELR